MRSPAALCVLVFLCSNALADTASVRSYQKTVQRILDAAAKDDGAWAKLEHLSDRIGHRLSGSKALEEAVIYTQQAMVADGLVARAEPVMVPHWVRGAESAAMIAPRQESLAMLGLGNSIGTPKKGITADVMVVHSFDELEALGDKVKGKIVLFNVPMQAFSEEHGSGYGDVVAYRSRGASRAARLGAKAMLLRSLTAHSLRSPHTGALHYEEGVAKIPAAALSVEDAEMIDRLSRSGKTVRVKLQMAARMLPDIESANVIGELRGSERPEEIVLLGAHLDSWDVGQGAHDDGSGCVTMMQAVALLKKLNLTPRRTIRVVLFTNEENGLRGAHAYAEQHAAEIKNHVLAVEHDTGAFEPRGFRVEGKPGVLDDTKQITAMLKAVGATEAKNGGSGADIEPLAERGVPALGLWVRGETYFDYHHTHADTLDKIDPAALRKAVGAIAALAFIAADMPRRYGE
jgi:carboxypeptidase Q